MKNQWKNYTNQLLETLIKENNIHLAADLADIQFINRFNRGNIFLLCVIDIYSKYAWVIPLKDKKRNCNH